MRKKDEETSDTAMVLPTRKIRTFQCGFGAPGGLGQSAEAGLTLEPESGPRTHSLRGRIGGVRLMGWFEPIHESFSLLLGVDVMLLLALNRQGFK